jgi:hypothetical protein
MLGRQQDFAAPHKDGRPRRKAAQEGKAAKDTEDPLVKLERVVELLDRGLLSVREYELLKQHILTDLLSTALGWPPTAQDQGRGGGRPLEDAGSFTARARGRSASEVGTGRSQTLEPTVAVEPAQHGAKVDGGSRRPPAFAAEPLEPISCSPTAVGATVAVQPHVKVQARTVMARGRQQEASKPSATSPRWAAATRCGVKGPSNDGEGANTRPPARGRARGGRKPPSAVHASFGRGARQGGAEPRGASRPRPTPARERPASTVGGHVRQGGFSSERSIRGINNSLQGRSSSICSQERDAGAALQQGGRPPRQASPERRAWRATPEQLARCAGMAEFFGWSRPLHESLPLAGAALEAGSASEPLGTPVVDVPTQPTFLLGTAMDLHGDAETLRVSVPMQTPGPAPALAPSPGEEKEKITAMPVAGRRSSGAVGVSASETAAGVAELSGAASAAGGGGELALCHVASARSFAVRGALPAGGDSVDGDGGTSGAVAGCEVEAGVTAPRSGPGSLSVRFAQIAAMSVPVEAERASLATDVVRALTAEVVTPDVHRALPVGVVQSVSSPQTASVSLTHQHELQRAMITSVDSDKAQSHRLQSSAEATGGSDNGITNLESAGALLQQERALIVSQSDVGSQLQQVCEAQVPRRSTASSVDDGGLGGLQRLEIWTGKSQAPERFGILLRLWSLLLRRQGGIILRL